VRIVPYALRICVVILYQIVVVIIFFSNAGELRIIVLRRKERGKEPRNSKLYRLVDSPELQTPRPLPEETYYPGAAMAWRRDRPLAPATDHNRASSLAAVRAAATHGASPSKTHRFLCFQIIHAPNTTMELKPFLRCSSCTRIEETLHQPSKESSVCCGANVTMPTG
jgi:hypothetical protein